MYGFYHLACILPLPLTFLSHIKIYVSFSALLFSLLFLDQSRQGPFHYFFKPLVCTTLIYLFYHYLFTPYSLYHFITTMVHHIYFFSIHIFHIQLFIKSLYFFGYLSPSQYLPLVYFPEAGLHLVVTIAEHASQVAPKRILRLSIHLLQIFFVKYEYMRSL